ncbi:MAG: TIGR00153 family protein [Gammaproteobacteria bacterium]|nr:TIGR00153 family protein [Gammaproteobacteria bacterium]
MSSPLMNMFKRSPLKYMQEHMRVVMECVREVPPLFDALIAGDKEQFTSVKDRIFEREAAADKIKNQLRAGLPKSLFMPVDRRDLLEILQLQDSIADTAQDIAGLLLERPMEVPAGLEDPLVKLVSRCVDVCEKSSQIIEELDELLEMGFRGREATQVESMVDQLNQIEDETDELGIDITRRLFAQEDDMNPVSVIMWYRLIQWIGDLADYAEKVGDRLRLLTAR